MDWQEELKKLKNIEPRHEKPERYSERRPWGGFDRFVFNELCSVKILTVMPGQAISLQSHERRSEWWVILDAKLDVEKDGKRITLHRGEDIFFPAGSKHRAFGLDKPCRWLEIAFGVNEEDGDIHRYDDQYGRT